MIPFQNNIFSSLIPSNLLLPLSYPSLAKSCTLTTFITFLILRYSISTPSCATDIYPSTCPPSNPNCYGGLCISTCTENTSICSSFAAPVCSPKGVCVPCSSDGDCSIKFPGTQCIGTLPTTYCGECLMDTDCTSPAAPLCQGNKMCGGCTADSHCSRFPERTKCNTGTRECVEQRFSNKNICSDDSECPPKQYCTTSSTCKSVKATFTTQSNNRIIPQNRIAITINVDPYPSDGSPTYSWSVSQPGLTFRESTSQTMEIRVFEDINPLPSSLTVAFTISNSLGDTDTITKTINLNSPPYGGTLSVSPTIGEALNTIFTLTANGWTDPEGDSMQYKFYFATDENREYVPLSIAQASNTLSTKLPPGLLENQYYIYVRVAVTDPYDIENVFDTKVQVSLPLVELNDELLTELQNISSGESLPIAYAQAVLTASYLRQLETEIIDGPLNECNKHIALKEKVIDLTTSELVNLGISATVAERAFYVIRAITSNRLFTPETIATKALDYLDNILYNMVSSSVTVRIEALRDGLKAIENLFEFTLENCTLTSSFATNLVSKFNRLINYFSAIEVHMYNSTDPYVIEANTFYLCIQQDVHASTLKGRKIFIFNGVSIEFPTEGVNLPDTSYVDIQFLLPKPNYKDCTSSPLSLSPYQWSIKQYKTLDTLVSPNGVLIVNLCSSVSASSSPGMMVLESPVGGDITYQTAPSQSNELESLITGSNIEKLGNVGALLDFNIFSSSLFYIVGGFTLLMVGVSVWSVYKDRHLDRDVIVLPKKSPSNLYRLLVYLLISHTFFGIFALFDKNQPRIMRSVLFYIKILGMMGMSAIFNQTEKDLGILQKCLISIITLVCITPINQIIGYLVFKRQLQPKMRRKRLALQTRKVATPAEKKAEEKQKKLTKIFNSFGYSLVFLIILGYLYITFVITANNVKTNQGVVSKWLEGFLQSTGLDFFGIQIVQVFIHLGIISTLQQENKKKFLCIPRRHLPMLLNPNILDYKKRFAALDRLYKDGLAEQVEETEMEGEETPESSPYLAPRMNRINQAMMRSNTRKPTLKASSNDPKVEIPEVKIELHETTEQQIASESPEMTEVKLHQADDSPTRNLETNITIMQTEGTFDTNENPPEEKSPERSPKRSLSRLKTIRSRKHLKERSPTIELKTDLNE